MARLTLTQGLPASGKSTWAKEQVRSAGGRIKRINRDSLRAMLDDSLYSPENEQLVCDLQMYAVSRAFRLGFDVVVDDTNFDPEVRERLHVAAKIGMQDKPGEPLELFIKDFTDVPFGVCIARDSRREGVERVGEDVIRRMAERWSIKDPGSNGSIPE